MIDILVADYLKRNGVILERARRQGRSLSAAERSIVLSGRIQAATKGMSREQINGYEMQGERDWEKVMRPIKVKVVFAFYHEPFQEIPATASYYVLESNHASIPQGGNVGVEELLEAGFKVPKTPTYEKWVKNGRKVVRS